MNIFKEAWTPSRSFEDAIVKLPEHTATEFNGKEKKSWFAVLTALSLLVASKYRDSSAVNRPGPPLCTKLRSGQGDPKRARRKRKGNLSVFPSGPLTTYSGCGGSEDLQKMGRNLFTI